MMPFEKQLYLGVESQIYFIVVLGGISEASHLYLIYMGDSVLIPHKPLTYCG